MVFYFSSIKLRFININLEFSITKSLNNVIYIFYILSACFGKDKDIIKIYNIVVVKGVI